MKTPFDCEVRYALFELIALLGKRREHFADRQVLQHFIKSSMNRSVKRNRTAENRVRLSKFANFLSIEKFGKDLQKKSSEKKLLKFWEIARKNENHFAELPHRDCKKFSN